MSSIVKFVLRPYEWHAWHVTGATVDAVSARPGNGNSFFEVDTLAHAHWWKMHGGGDPAYGRSIWSASFNTGVLAGVSSAYAVSLLLAGKRVEDNWPMNEKFAFSAGTSVDAGWCWDKLTSEGFNSAVVKVPDTGLLVFSAYRAPLVSGPYSFADGVPRHAMSWATVTADWYGEQVYDANYTFLEVDCDFSTWAEWPRLESSYNATVFRTFLTDAAEYVAMTALLGAPYSALATQPDMEAALSPGVYDESGYVGIDIHRSFAVGDSLLRWLNPWTVEVDLSSLRSDEPERRTVGGVVLSVGDVPVAYAKFRKPTLGELARIDAPVALRLSLDRAFLTSTGAYVALASVLSRGDLGVAGGRYLELYSADPRGPRQAEVVARSVLEVGIGGFVRQDRGLWTNTGTIQFDPLVASGYKLGTHLGLKVGDELLMVLPLRDAVPVTSGSELAIQPGMLALRFT